MKSISNNDAGDAGDTDDADADADADADTDADTDADADDADTLFIFLPRVWHLSSEVDRKPFSI